MNLGEWVTGKYKTQAAFAEKLNVRQGQVSRWISGANEISEGYQKEIRNLGYKGPWPEKIAAKGSREVTREEFAELYDAVEDCVAVIRALLQSLPEGSRPMALPKRFR